MRISDWSSDVCSSDLLGPSLAGGDLQFLVEHELLQHLGLQLQRLDLLAEGLAQRLGHRGLLLQPAPRRAQRGDDLVLPWPRGGAQQAEDRKSTRLNSSH